MTGESLFNKLSKRDYSGSDSDEYAQLLLTIHSQLSASGEEADFFSLLEKAESEGKKITVTELEEQLTDEILYADLTLA